MKLFPYQPLWAGNNTPWTISSKHTPAELKLCFFLNLRGLLTHQEPVLLMASPALCMFNDSLVLGFICVLQVLLFDRLLLPVKSFSSVLMLK